MFFKVAHVKIFFVASFDFTHVFFSSFFVFEMNLHVLFEIGGCGEGFAAFLADEWFLLGVNSFVTVEVGLLVEFLVAVFVVALVWLYSRVNHFVALEGGFYLKRLVAVSKRAFISLFFVFYM